MGDDEDALPRAVRTALPRSGRFVLAVSGGRDSMVLLDAMARVCPRRVACVATFDHATGEWATRAAGLAAARARTLGFAVRRARASAALRTEAAWRDARWSFLRQVAHDTGARVATAHTRDDHVETVFLRALRGAGARGLAALLAESDVVRPLLAITRERVTTYAATRGLAWVEDPSNQSRRFQRNRVRLDLLPACNRAHPGFTAELLALSARAAMLRRAVDRFVQTTLLPYRDGGALVVARGALSGYDAQGLCLLWPALAASLGVALDRRGTERAAQFTIHGQRGGRIQLSGGFEIVRHDDRLLLRRRVAPAKAVLVRALNHGMVVAGFQFLRVPSPPRSETARAPSLWVASFPTATPLTVRSWRPGDRMTPVGARRPRRLKGLFRDAGVDAASRLAWPVVLAGEEIVWVPGVRRSRAATVRSGGPVVLFRCEHHDG